MTPEPLRAPASPRESSELMTRAVPFVFWAAVMVGGVARGEAPPAPANPPAETPKPSQLPFAIADEKRLDADELAEKKEGRFLTGLPQISSDPVSGFGLGADGFFYFNGTKADPFFEYTPYRAKLELHVFATNKSQKEILFGADVPYLFGSKWRMRVEGGYEDNPNLLYFGKSAATLGPLVYGGQAKPTYESYADAQDTIRPGGVGEAAQVTDLLYNTYRKREAKLDLQFERSFLDSTLRIVGGFEAANVQITTFDGQTSDARDPATGARRPVPNGTSLLTQDERNNGLVGVGYNFITIAQLGIVYDTRDLEPDPSRGVFVELTGEFSSKLLGSNRDFTKFFLHGKYFVPILPSVFDKLVFAARGALEYTDGDAPFYEYQDGWSTEGSIEGLGGLRTLRGYKDFRFLSRWMGYVNLELRYRFADCRWLGQHFAFMAVPFFDTGRVWDKLSDLGIGGFKSNGGLGLRIAWNQSTILMFDYAMSSEDQQFFFNFGHIF